MPHYECLLFDVDDTLYALSSGISAEIIKNISEYMITKLGIEESKVPEMCVQLCKDYGTTMAGLKAIGYDFDYDDYHGFVHGRLPYELLKPDPILRNILHCLPIRKFGVFPHSLDLYLSSWAWTEPKPNTHVAKVLSRLGLEDCFDDVICFETLNPTHNSNVFENNSDASELPKTPIVCKPCKEAFERAFQIAKVNPQKALFFDDSIRNLQTGERLGLHTVWVGSSHRSKGADYALESIHNIREALPELWEVGQKSGDFYSGEAAIETSVRT